MLSKVRSLFSAQDMTRGKVLNNMIRFSVPLLIGNFAQQLYSTIDSIVVGRSVPGGLAAIGATMPVIFFMLLMFMAISTGAGIMVSQFFGARDFKRLGKTIGNTLMLVFFSGIVIMIVAIVGARPMLTLLNTPPEILDMSVQYMVISFIGILGAAYYNIGSGILRGLGDSFTPLLFLLLSTVLNTILDIVFVWQLGWGVAGAAWATIISQAISAILVLLRLYRMPTINHLTRADIKPDFKIIKELLRLGLPAGFTQGIFSLAMIMVQNLTNQMGTLVLEANTAVIRVDGFAMMPNFTFGMAATTFIGQNIGARKLDRVEEGAKVVSRLALFVSLFLSLMIVLFGRYLLALFTTSEQVISLGTGMMSILAVGYVAISQTQAFGGIMRGAGDTMPSMWISLFTTVGLRVPLAYLLTYLTRSEEWPHGSPYMLNVSLLLGWIIGAVATYLWYKRGNWRDKSTARLSGHQPAPEEVSVE